MNTEIKKLNDERGEIVEKMQSIYETARSENREVTAEEETRFDELNQKDLALEKKIGNLKIISEKKFDEIEKVEKIAEKAKKSVNEIEDEKEMAKKCLKSYLLRGFAGMTAEEKEFATRAQSTTTDSEGGYTVPLFMGDKIVESLKQYGGMRSVCDIITTSSGATIEYPTNNDTTNTGAWLAEGSAAAEQDLVFGQKLVEAWTASSKYIRVNAQLLQDSAFDIEAFLVKQLSTRLGRIANTGYTTGSGSSQPHGIVDDAELGKAAAAVAATTFSELLDLKHSVDRDYRMNGSWMFNDNTLVALKKVAIASANQSLWQPGIIGSEPATIDGDPYTVNNDMPDMAAGNHAILYGDFKRYLIRDAQGINIRRSEHIYFLNNQVTFLGEMRTDGILLDTAAVKHMRMSNT